MLQTKDLSTGDVGKIVCYSNGYRKVGMIRKVADGRVSIVSSGGMIYLSPDESVDFPRAGELTPVVIEFYSSVER